MINTYDNKYQKLYKNSQVHIQYRMYYYQFTQIQDYIQSTPHFLAQNKLHKLDDTQHKYCLSYHKITQPNHNYPRIPSHLVSVQRKTA